MHSPDGAHATAALCVSLILLFLRVFLIVFGTCAPGMTLYNGMWSGTWVPTVWHGTAVSPVSGGGIEENDVRFSRYTPTHNNAPQGIV